MLDKNTEPAVDMALQPSAAVEGTNADLPLYDGLLAKGKRNLMCKEIPEAVNQLQEAARIVAEKFGETANECAEVYLQYGMALLELARMENTVLGNALTGIPAEPAGMEEENVTENTFVEPDETTEEEKAKISDEIIDAMVESEDQGKNAVSEEGKDCSDGDKKDPVQMETEAENSAAANVDSSETDKAVKDVTGKEDSDKVEDAAKDIEDTAGEGGEEGEEEIGEETEDPEENTEEAMEGDDKEDKNNTSQDEVTNLQLAWEMIELSKSIYKRGELEDSKLKQAECMIKLGEIGLETEQYVQAVSDFQECIAILESVVEPSSRRLAETHYQMALAHGYNEAFDDAISQFQMAISIIELKIAELNSFIQQGPGIEVTEEAKEAARKELEDLQNLIPDIKIKIDDAKEEKKAQGLKEVIRQSFKSDLNGGEGTSSAFQNGASTSPSSFSAAPVKPVQDITHLVRKKRDIEESEATKSDEKKHKADDEVKDSELRSNGSVESTPANNSLEPEIVEGPVKILPMETGSA